MILTRDRNTGYFVKGPDGHYLSDVHAIEQCIGRGCAIHNRPSNHRLKTAPLNWRVDRGILERICVHGAGHIDADSAIFHKLIGKEYLNVHGCDGCC